jgi:hypothetical protein
MFSGLGVATAFEREGYTVYGLTRTEEKAKILEKHESECITKSAL